MGHVIPLAKINQFLPVNKMQVEAADHDVMVKDLEETAKNIVFAKLAVSYSTTNWVDAQTIPSLVQQIIGMLTAGWIFTRQYAETDDADRYGHRRIREAYSLLDGILDGTYFINQEVIVDQFRLPSFLETQPVFIMEERH